jgi:hypothetical protein
MTRTDARQFSILFLSYTHTHAHAHSHASQSASTSEGPRDVLSEEQLSLLVWTRWVVRMLPYYRAQLRGVQQTVIRGEMKTDCLLNTAFCECVASAVQISKLCYVYFCVVHVLCDVLTDHYRCL